MNRDDRDQRANRWLMFFIGVAVLLIAIWLVAVVFTYS